MFKADCRLLLSILFLTASSLLGQVEQKYSIRRDEAATTLRQFSIQANVNLIYTPDDVEGVITNPVIGLYLPREALGELLKGTPLAYNEDVDTGAFAIIRSESAQAPEEQRAEQQESLIEKIAVVLFGESTPTGAKKPLKDQIFELSPFEVDASRDLGYLAASTLTGGRLNTRLADTAASVTVITKEFIEDTGLSDIQEIARYSLGTVNHTQETSPDPNINNYISGANTVRRIRVRGIQATKGINYFESLIPDDAYRVERYDESRGPNGILFGISDAGGIINTTTLRASPYSNSASLKYSTGTYQRDRLEGVVNRVILQEKLGIVIAGVNQDNGGWRDFENDRRRRIYGAVTFEPTEKISIQVLGESGKHHLVTLRPFNATDEFLAWYRNRELLGVDAVTGYPGVIRNSPDSASQALGVTGTLTNRNNTRYVYVANNASFFDAAGTWISGSYDDRDVAPVPGSLEPSGVEADNPAKIMNPADFPYPYHLNAGGPDMFRDTDFEMLSVFADIKLTDELFLNIAHGYQNSVIDAQYVAGDEPRLRGDPNVIQRHPVKDSIDPGALNPFAGRLYFDANWRRDDHFAESRETKLSLSYDLDFRDWGMDIFGRHRFGAGISMRKTSDTLVQKRWAFLGNPFHDTQFDHRNNRVAARRYIEEGNFDAYGVAAPPFDQDTIVDDTGEMRTIGWVHGTRGTGNSRGDQEIDSIIAVLQSYFHDEKVVTSVGYRRDDSSHTAFGYVVDPLFGDTIVSHPSADGYHESGPIATDTRTFGIVYHAIPRVSLLANYSTSIGLPEFMNRVLPEATAAPPIEGTGKDVGISFSLLEDRISGRLVYFETEEKNQTASGGITRILRNPNIFSMEALDQVFADLRKPDGTPYSELEWQQEVDALTPDFNAVLQDNSSKGWELSMVANFTTNWRLLLNASITDRITMNYAREAIKWMGWRRDPNGRLINGIRFVDGGDGDGYWQVDRSVYVPGTPVDRILEIAENAVGWDAGTIITDNNDESIAETHYLQMAELQEQIDERQKRWGLSPYKFNVFTAYEFSDGWLNGLSLGAGFRWLSGEIIGEDLNGNEFKSPAVHFVDLMLKYSQVLKRGRGIIDYQLNIYNLFDKQDVVPVRYSVMTDNSSPLSRFRLPEPLTARVSVTFSF